MSVKLEVILYLTNIVCLFIFSKSVKLLLKFVYLLLFKFEQELHLTYEILVLCGSCDKKNYRNHCFEQNNYHFICAGETKIYIKLLMLKRMYIYYMFKQLTNNRY